MPPQPPPFLCPSSGNEEKGGDGDYRGEKEDLQSGSSPSTELRLETHGIIEDKKRKSLFNAAQLHELYHQFLIFNFIFSSLPVPFHLLLPAWKSVFGSFGPAIYQNFPRFRSFSPKESVVKSLMDPEPGRCRRTDGRKWRCSKSVVPNGKYCESHMHRGCVSSRNRAKGSESITRLHCSRKHVEAHITISNPHTKAINSVNNTPPRSSFGISGTNEKISDPKAIDLKASVRSSGTDSCVPPITKHGINISDGLSTMKSTMDAHSQDIAKGHAVCADAGKFMTPPTKDIVHDSSVSYRNAHIDGKKLGSDNVNVQKIKAMGFGMSPRSVLQNAPAAGNNDMNSDHQEIREAEPRRCWRTDGKKWRCKRDAIPNRKYCETHLYRGSKRVKVAPSYQSICTPSAPESVHNSINLNAEPPVSTTTASPRHTEDNSADSSSGGTTISDENISISRFQPSTFTSSSK